MLHVIRHINHCCPSNLKRFYTIVLKQRWIPPIILVIALGFAGNAGAATKIAAGGTHTAAVKSDGTLWAWGANGIGQLGDGSLRDAGVPVKVGTDTHWVSIAAGYGHTVAVKSDGTLWAWGDNGFGQLGNGSYNSSGSTPVQITSAGDGWVSVAAGANHTVGVKSDGTLWAWGVNDYAQLGIGNTTGPQPCNFGTPCATSPIRIGADANWVSAAGGDYYTVALKSDGTLWAWGDNSNGELGAGSILSSSTPTQIGVNTKWVSVAAGATHTLAVKSDGTLWAWGDNYYGNVGCGGACGPFDVPQQIEADTKWVSVAAGFNHSVAVKSDGTLWAWGENVHGELGIGSIDSNAHGTPVQIGTSADWVSVSASNYHTVAMKSNGTFWAWGWNNSGQVGDGSSTNRSSPVWIDAYAGRWSFVSAGRIHAAALAANGTLWAWGENGNGQLGNRSTRNRFLPEKIGIDNQWILVAGGDFHTAGIKSNGTLWAWGDNGNGQLGAGAIASSNTPTQIGIDTKWAAVSAGASHTVGLKSDGTLWAWGDNGNGQLGAGAIASSNTPTQIGTDTKWVSASAGTSHTVGVKSDGTFWSWGDNGNGQLGAGTIASSNTPTQIGTDTKWMSASAGTSHTVGVKSDGTLWAWGDNTYGQLGAGAIASSNTPTQIGIDTKWVSVAAGDFHTLGLQSDGTLWSWGNNADGQVGDGTTTQRPNPVQMFVQSPSTANNDWVRISAGSNYSIAVKSDGTIWLWGNNINGQLGDGTNAAQLYPEQLFAGNNWLSVTAGGAHIGLKRDKTLWTWGGNSDGQLGDGTYTGNMQPAQIGLGQWDSVSAGGNYSVALSSGGSLWAWGGDQWGQLGDGMIFDRNTPFQIGTDTWAAIAAGWSHTIGIKPDGTLWTWGSNSDGQLGLGSASGPQTCSYGAACSTIPVQVGTDTNWASIAAGTYYSFALKSDGTLWAWGRNNYGQLGIGSLISASTPTQVGTDTDWVAVAAGFNHTVAVKSNGTLWAWGWNYYGQLGLGNATGPQICGGSACSMSPVQVGTDTNWMSIAASSGEHTVAVKSDGTLWAWGWNSSGQLGDGTTTQRNAPVPIGSDTDWMTAATGLYTTDAVKLDGSLWSWGLGNRTPQQLLASLYVAKSGYGSGTISALGLSCGVGLCFGNYDYGVSVTITATADANSSFAGWYNCPSVSGATCTATALSSDQNQKITALFNDTSLPSGTISISPDFVNGPIKYSKSSTLNLTLSASDPAGVSQMKFSENGSGWSALEAYSTFKQYVLMNTTDGIHNVWVQFKDAAGNLSSSVTATILLDSTAPATTADPGEGSYSTAKTVTLTCNDHGGVGCASTWFSLDGSDNPPSIPYTGPLTIPQATTLKYYSKDVLGNAESVKTASYSFVQGYTQLSLELSQPTVEFNGSVMAWGRLQNQSGNNADPTGQTIKLVITGPTGPGILTTTVYSQYGDYIFNNVTGFGQKGAYGLTAEFDGSSLLAPATSTSQPLLVGASAGYAVLVEGKILNNEGLESHNKTANRIYQKLKNRGFVDDNIYYLNYGTTQIGVRGLPSKAAVQSALETWAQSRMNGMPAPLYVIMVDHGSPDQFHIDSETITPDDLNTWLGVLETGLTAEALKERRVIIIGACYSGSFIPELSSAPTNSSVNGGRIIVTSAAPDETSYKGPMENDGIRSGEFFLEEFFTQLERGYTLRDSFVEATGKTKDFTQKGDGSGNSNAPYYDGAVQHPLLDDNGDGAGTNSLTDDQGADGIAAEGIHLGIGVGYNQNSADFPVDLTAVTETVFLSSSDTGHTLWATVTDNSQVDSAVWMEIRQPSLILTSSGGSDQQDLNTIKIPMLYSVGNDRWERDPSSVSAPFDQSGKYEVFYFVRDKETLKLSPMKRSVVYKAKAGNLAPGAFELLAPADYSSPETVLSFLWTAATDSNPITYTLLVSKQPDFSAIDYKKEEITGTMTAVGDEGGFQDHTTYYWQVEAIDTYGALTSSPTWSFHSDNMNGLPGIIAGYVTDAANGTAIAASSIYSAGTGTVTSAANGAYMMTVPAGGVSLSASKAGYQNASSMALTVAAGSVTTKNIHLTSTSNPVYLLTINKSGAGSGGVTSSPTGTSCGASGMQFTDSASVTLTATPSPDSVFAGWSGACSGSGGCTVSMSGNKTVTAAFTLINGVDTMPDQFFLSEQKNAPLNTAVISNTVTLSGINAPTTISIIGGLYSVNGGVTYTALAGKVGNGSTVTVKVVSSTAYSTTKSATLAVGGISDTFNVTTGPKDTVPDLFSFTPVASATLNTFVTSGTVTVTGINALAPITIIGGSYSIKGGAFTTAAGTIANGSSLRVQVHSSATYTTDRSATVTIGGVSATFTVTTVGLTPGITLADAVDNPKDIDLSDLIFTTGSTTVSADWSGENGVSYSGGDAAQSGKIASKQSTWMETTVHGPFSVAFFQKVSSASTSDTLKFYLDGVLKSTISGEINWQQKVFSVPTGTIHTLRWTYAKSGITPKGMDAAWVDKIVVSPYTKVTLLSPNGGGIVTAGTTTTVSWSAQAQAEKFKLSYSLDNGTTWKTITTDYVPGPSYDWTVPSIPATRSTCKVKVTGYTVTNALVGSDISDKVFTIAPAP